MLLQQSKDVADLLEMAVRELSHARAEGETITLVNDQGVRTVKVTGQTPEERKHCVMSAYVLEISELLVSPDGTNEFAVNDRAGALRLLEDPLTQPTRTARRNLLAASALVFLMGATRQMPGRVPGFEFDLKGHPWIIGSLAVAVLAYQFVSFVLYARTDGARRALAEEQICSQVKDLKTNVNRAGTALKTLNTPEDASSFDSAATSWLIHAKCELERLEYECSTARYRGRWDLWLPIPLVIIALLTFVVRSLVNWSPCID